MQAFRRQDPQMLEITLTPAPVARRKIDERGRTFFIASAKAWQHVDCVTGPPYQRGLDKIMAEDMTTEGRPPRRTGNPQCAAKALVRMIALWPQ